VFRHFLAASNELLTPKVLVCPDDKPALRATSFSAPLGNANISYFAGFDARESQPSTLLLGDRHITGGRLHRKFLRVYSTNSTAAWITNLHNGGGNVAMADGSVARLSSAGLTSLVRSNAPFRLAIPR
jgi:prepilin-type processing-associated H-X9-DG protein